MLTIAGSDQGRLKYLDSFNQKYRENNQSPRVQADTPTHYPVMISLATPNKVSELVLMASLGYRKACSLS